MKMLVNLLCRDIDAQLAFYQSLLGLAEMPERRSPIYRALDTGASELGFNAPAARELLALPPSPAEPSPGVFATFMLADAQAVDATAGAALRLGGRVLKAPYATYYGQWQSVLADPEGQVFRVSTLALPRDS
jgi:predicted enzyme related to lactoylglutathione lyase